MQQISACLLARAANFAVNFGLFVFFVGSSLYVIPCPLMSCGGTEFLVFPLGFKHLISVLFLRYAVQYVNITDLLL